MGRLTQQAGPRAVTLLLDTGTARDGIAELRIRTERGVVFGLLHKVEDSTQGVVMVGGAGGGVTGPASIYPDLAVEMAAQGFTSLRLDYRHAAHLEESVWDTLAGIAALAQLGITRVALIGWSFGGAVAIAAGALSPETVGVATVASQSYGTESVSRLAPKAILLLHGSSDNTLPPACSEDIYRRAGEPRELIIYPGANHGLDQVRGEMKEQLTRWLLRVLSPTGGA